MITLTINNSYSTIKGLSAIQEKQLRSHLSYTVGGSSAFFSGYGPRKKSLLAKDGSFPTGLIHRVDDIIKATQVADLRTRPRSEPQQVTLDEKPYQWQVDAVKQAIMYARGIISAPTGTGKSKAIALLLAYLNIKSLVVVPSLEIKKQLQETLKGIPDVTVENIDSAALKTAKDFGCLIIDEAHHVAAKTYQKLNKTVWRGIYYRFFFTATPFRNDTEETLLFESIAGQVIYSLDYKTAVSNRYIVPVESYYVEVPKHNTDAYTYAQVYKELVVDNVLRNILISKLLLTLRGSKSSTLCLVREVEHGKTLSAMTGIPFVSGEDDASRDYIGQFNSGRQTALIATTGVMGEGIDSKPCEYVVIAGLGKAKSQFMQQCGRAVRRYEGKESAKVIIFKDKSHKFTTRHYNAQRAILKEEYGSVPLKLEVG